MKTQQKKKQNGKGDSKGKGHLDMLKIKCFNCGEYGNFAHDCPKACNNANIAQESEQKGKLETMLDLDSTSVCKECVMVCTELQYENADEDQIVYRDQGINTEEYEKATYGNFMKTQSEEEEEVKCTVAQKANNSVVLERKRRRFNKNNRDEKPDGDSQSDTLISENCTVKSINKSTMVAQGPADDDDENESHKAWIMEMLMNDSNISMSMMNEQESMSEDDKKFLYARAVHSNHSIEYHMHQIIEQQKVVDEYKSMTMEGMDLTPLESNLHKYDLVIISQIIKMIETDVFCHHKAFESVLSNLQNMWMEGIHELENTSMYCINNTENNDEMDRVEVIDLCSISQTKTEVCGKGRECAKQESQDKAKSDATNRMEDEIRTKKSKSTTKNGEVETTMMCWEVKNDLPEKEPHKEQEKVEKNPIEKTEKPKHEEEHVEPTLNIGN